ncbi:hypothetical protein SOVF_164360 [Spinacia oleracea]|nr:hypothetical protein SOVF_164360 [Spinacia oleracea]
MASLVLLVSEFLHPKNTQIVYTYSSSVATAASDLQTKKKKISVTNYAQELIKVEIRQKQLEEVDDNDDLPHLRIDSELVWP